MSFSQNKFKTTILQEVVSSSHTRCGKLSSNSNSVECRFWHEKNFEDFVKYLRKFPIFAQNMNDGTGYK